MPPREEPRFGVIVLFKLNGTELIEGTQLQQEFLLLFSRGSDSSALSCTSQPPEILGLTFKTWEAKETVLVLYMKDKSVA